ncbi:unnamed protein product [Caenorhabditis auriculariae]|uniref:Uncharacterized protein n=1 Tax=Caenorhabditis auriculariae TaxID=2777116 RepID=A0A8S1HMC2_9PELO|nr:unnamed protein product [Caenorhabditis auriculariae]
MEEEEEYQELKPSCSSNGHWGEISQFFNRHHERNLAERWNLFRGDEESSSGNKEYDHLANIASVYRTATVPMKQKEGKTSFTCELCLEEKTYELPRSEIGKIDRSSAPASSEARPGDVCPICAVILPRGTLIDHFVMTHQEVFEIVDDVKNRDLDVIDFNSHAETLIHEELFDAKLSRNATVRYKQIGRRKSLFQAFVAFDGRRQSFIDDYRGNKDVSFIFRLALVKKRPAYRWYCVLCEEEHFQDLRFYDDISVKIFALAHLIEKHNQYMDDMYGADVLDNEL